MVVLGFFFFKDLNRLLKNWFLLKFQISRKNLIKVTFFNENKRKEERYLRIEDGLIKPPDEGKTYNMDESKVVFDENNIPNIHYLTGNATSIDIYKEGKANFSSAQLQDAAIKMAMVAAEAGPLFEFITWVKKWLPLLVGGILITAAIMGVLLFIVFDMAGNIDAITSVGQAISA